LSKGTVINIYSQATWERVPIGMIDRFADACRVDITRTKYLRRFLKNSKRTYLLKASPGQRRMVERLRKFAGNHRMTAAGDS